MFSIAWNDPVKFDLISLAKGTFSIFSNEGYTIPKRHYQKVHSRKTVHLFPPSRDDYVAADNPVRVIDATVEMLDFHELGFCHADARSGSGQPPFGPALLLKLYIYGYQN